MEITYRTSSDGAIVFPVDSYKAWAIQLLLVFTAVLLPAIAHLSGAPVRWLLPMHWPIIFAALLYGWRGGLTVGALAPASNWLLTGYPLLVKAFPMTFELTFYGLVIGWLRQRGWNSFAAVACGLISGRVIFLTVIALTGAHEVAFGQYIMIAIVPGLVAGAIQAAIIPLLSSRIIKGSK